MMFTRIIATALALTASVAPATGSWAKPAGPKGLERLEGELSAPKTPFVDEKGMQTNIDTFEGKILVLNFWATWCNPCIKEMPSLDRLAARLPSDTFAVVAVSQDNGGVAVAKPFLDRIGVHGLAIYADPNRRLSREFGVRGFPTTFLIGREGTVIGRLEGAIEWDRKDVVAYLLSLAQR